MMKSLASWGAKGFCKQHHCNAGTYGVLLPSVAILSQCQTELVLLGKDLNNDVFRLMGLD